MLQWIPILKLELHVLCVCVHVFFMSSHKWLLLKLGVLAAAICCEDQTGHTAVICLHLLVRKGTAGSLRRGLSSLVLLEIHLHFLFNQLWLKRWGGTVPDVHFHYKLLLLLRLFIVVRLQPVTSTHLAFVPLLLLLFPWETRLL